MTEVISKRIAYFLLKTGSIKNKDDVEVYAYGLELLISSFTNIFFIIFISLLLGRPVEAFAFFLAFIPLRVFAGGYHANTHFKCFGILLLVYSINLSLLYFISKDYLHVLVPVFSICSLLLIFLYAPVDDVNKPLTSEEKSHYRKVSIKVAVFQMIIIWGFFIFNRETYFILSFSYGQLAAAFSLLAVKIKNKRGKTDEKIKNVIDEG